MSLKQGDSSVELADAAHNLGIVLKFTISHIDYVNSIFKSLYMYICNIFRDIPYVPICSRISLANVLVSNHLDYCNLLLVDIKSNMLKFPRVQDSLARAITNIMLKYGNIISVLKSLH